MQKSMTILMTTHSMEEADALCSRIAIMTSQGIQCIGSPVHLKNKYGKGLLFSVSLADPERDVKDFVRTAICGEMEFLEENFNVYSFTVAKEKVDLTHVLVTVMKLHKTGVITRWSISESSLDDVFQHICMKEEQYVCLFSANKGDSGLGRSTRPQVYAEWRV